MKNYRVVYAICLLFLILGSNCKGDDTVLISCNASPRYFTKNKLLFVAIVGIKYKLFVYDKSNNSVKYFNKELDETYEVAFSPIRKEIAFIKLNHKDKNSNIFLSDIEGNTIKQITFKDQYHNNPFFSNDGNKLYFTRKAKDNFKMFFYCLDLETDEEKMISKIPFFVNSIPVLTQDDNFIIFAEGRRYQRIIKLNIIDGKYNVLKNDETLLATTINNKTQEIIFAESNYRYNETKAGTKVKKAIYSMNLNTKKTIKLFDENFWECTYIQVSPNNDEIMYMNSLNKLVISNFNGTNKRFIDLEKLIEEQIIKE